MCFFFKITYAIQMSEPSVHKYKFSEVYANSLLKKFPYSLVS